MVAMGCCRFSIWVFDGFYRFSIWLLWLELGFAMVAMGFLYGCYGFSMVAMDFLRGCYEFSMAAFFSLYFICVFLMLFYTFIKIYYFCNGRY